jgi:hypothetical protein
VKLGHSAPKIAKLDDISIIVAEVIRDGYEN